MEPLVVLAVVTAMLLGLGALGVRRLRRGWWPCAGVSRPCSR